MRPGTAHQKRNLKCQPFNLFPVGQIARKPDEVTATFDSFDQAGDRRLIEVRECLSSELPFISATLRVTIEDPPKGAGLRTQS